MLKQVHKHEMIRRVPRRGHCWTIVGCLQPLDSIGGGQTIVIHTVIRRIPVLWCRGWHTAL